jgi:hypothetical protein
MMDTSNFICNDCKFNTFHGEYYMLEDSVWREIVGNDKLIMLCIGCAERRFGRQLESVDFIRWPINYSYNAHSPRLRGKNRITVLSGL